MYNGKRYSPRKRFDNSFSRGGNRRGGNSSPRPNFSKSFNPEQIINQSRLPQADRAPVGQTEQPDYENTHKFSDFNIDEKLKQNISAKGYITPTPIQDQAIPKILEGKDIIGIANTGTGKTAAFLIPLIDKVLKNRSKKILIITPTRELAVQIADEFYSFSKGFGLAAVVCIGGAGIGRQKSDLRYPHNFVIGTPGRLKDLIRERALNLGIFENVVLDEADHMVDIGFIHDIKFIISYLHKVRQSLFFSATIDGKVKEILATFVTNPVTISVKTTDSLDNIEQEVIRVTGGNRKVDALHDLLVQKNYSKVLIFGRTKWGVQKLADELVQRGFKAGAIHGNKSQNQRLRVLQEFKSDRIQILLATDVASRGLDIDDVSHVINFDMPVSYEDYIHRIGRTGRANKKGTALTFV